MEGVNILNKSQKVKAIVVLLLILSITILPLFEGIKYLTTSPAMFPGSTGAEVKRLQQCLENWGYFDEGVSGKYDVETFFAIRNFQSDYGLSPTGLADTNTLLAMGFTEIRESGEVYARGVPNKQLLARAINGEARGEPYEGQVAVGAVILNRVKDSKFPKTINGVIYQPGAFTAVADGQINVPIKTKSTVVKAAGDALNGWDPTNGCIYYWNPATATSKWIWSRKIKKKIGKHNFGV